MRNVLYLLKEVYSLQFTVISRVCLVARLPNIAIISIIITLHASQTRADAAVAQIKNETHCPC